MGFRSRALSSLRPLVATLPLDRVASRASLRNRVVAATHANGLLDWLGSGLEATFTGLRHGYARFRCILGQSVLHLHDTVVELGAVELLDRVGGSLGLHIDQRSRAKVLTMHVLVEGRCDEGATLGEKFLKRQDSSEIT